jgi:hypothetical protein
VSRPRPRRVRSATAARPRRRGDPVRPAALRAASRPVASRAQIFPSAAPEKMFRCASRAMIFLRVPRRAAHRPDRGRHPRMMATMTMLIRMMCAAESFQWVCEDDAGAATERRPARARARATPATDRARPRVPQSSHCRHCRHHHHYARAISTQWTTRARNARSGGRGGRARVRPPVRRARFGIRE